MRATQGLLLNDSLISSQADSCTAPLSISLAHNTFVTAKCSSSGVASLGGKETTGGLALSATERQGQSENITDHKKFYKAVNFPLTA